jgi:hypothetical protein
LHGQPLQIDEIEITSVDHPARGREFPRIG